MVLPVLVQRSLLCQLQCLRLGLVHVAHSGDTEQIAQHPAVRSRLEPGFGTLCSVSVLHFSPLLTNGTGARQFQQLLPRLGTVEATKFHSGWNWAFLMFFLSAGSRAGQRALINRGEEINRSTARHLSQAW
jgi:hypothetical protein